MEWQYQCERKPYFGRLVVVLDGEKSNFKNQHRRQGLVGTAWPGQTPAYLTGCQRDERSFMGQGALKPFAVPSGHSGEPSGRVTCQYGRTEVGRG